MNDVNLLAKQFGPVSVLNQATLVFISNFIAIYKKNELKVRCVTGFESVFFFSSTKIKYLYRPISKKII